MSSSIHQKMSSWLRTVTSPNYNHTSGMLIVLGALAAASAASAQTVQSSSHQPIAHDPFVVESEAEPMAEVKEADYQEVLYYIALGMFVSQGLIRLLTWYSNRRQQNAEKTSRGLSKKNDDLLAVGSLSATRGAQGKSILDLEENSDTEDDDYEESEEESSSEEEEEEEEDETEEEDIDDESESEGELDRRRRVLATGEAEIEE